MKDNIRITTRDPFEIIRGTIRKAAALVAPTYGPASNKVIISKVTHNMVVDDGVQIMRDLEFPDTNENAVLKVIRETAIKTNDRAGDGTTGSVIMLDSIFEEVSTLRRRDGHKIERELRKGLAEATEQLYKNAKPVSKLEELVKVARVSFDNEEVAKTIAETWHKVGKEGVVTVELTPTMKTTSELTEGIKMTSGYLSPIMVNNPERMESVIEKPMILITDMRLTEGENLIPIFNKLAGEGKGRLLVIAENVEGSALATFIINQPHIINPHTQKPGVLQSVAIAIPQTDDRTTFLEDVALLTGGRVFSFNKGDKLEDATIEDLGTAEKVITQRDTCVIVKPMGNKSQIKKAMAELSAAINMTDDARQKDVLEKRLAFFANKIAVIKVGANTANEQKALKYKVEDAVNAVKSAFRSGVVCGSGLALARLETSSPLLNAALKAPHATLLENMGIELEKPIKDGEALNVVTGKTGKFLEVGVIDPVEVLVAGIESAVSIASLLLTVSGMIVERPQHMRTE